MAEFALLIAGEFRDIRPFNEKPDDIPHKSVVWLPVVRAFGEPFEGESGDAYMIRTIDPATLPEPVPTSVTPRQARLALLAAGKLTQANAAVAASDEETQLAWEFAGSVMRNDAGVVSLGAAIGLDTTALDDLFRTASKL